MQEIAIPKNKPREDSLSPSPKRVTYASKKEALYDSFLTTKKILKYKNTMPGKGTEYALLQKISI